MNARALLVVLAAFALGACAVDSGDATDEDADALEDALAASADPKGAPTRHPIVLEHGFNASTTNEWAFYKVKDALEKDGHRVYLSEVPPFNAPAERARYLARVVDRALAKSNARKVNIIAHSMGGLDARYLVSSMGYADRVASVTTIATPHKGTHVADLALHFVKDGPISNALDFIGALVGKRITDDALAKDTDLHAALVALSEKHTAAFDAANPDMRGVYYQSWAGVSSRIGIGDDADTRACEGRLPHGAADVMESRFRIGSVIVGHGFGFEKDFRPNDGLVTVDSAKHGRFRGCIRADHLDEVGQPKHDHPNRLTGFDHRKFYRVVAFGLAARGY